MTTYKVRLNGKTKESEQSGHKSFAPALVSVMSNSFQGLAEVTNMETHEVRTLKLRGTHFSQVDCSTQEYFEFQKSLRKKQTDSGERINIGNCGMKLSRYSRLTLR